MEIGTATLPPTREATSVIAKREIRTSPDNLCFVFIIMSVPFFERFEMLKFKKSHIADVFCDALEYNVHAFGSFNV